jgi:long-chain-fatty-acid--[acyl-carrier-protein] ligase
MEDAMKKICNFFIYLLLCLRYRISLRGLDSLKRNDKPILFLANHQALIDPVIVMSSLNNRFSPRPLADENQFKHPLLKPLVRILNIISIPDPAVSGRRAKEGVDAGLDKVADALNRGDNVLMYPAGGLCHTKLEKLGGKSGTASTVHRVPEVRIVLIRIRGLWGSSFSRATAVPSIFKALQKGALDLLANGFFFMPRREVFLEFEEVADFPRRAEKREINSYLEEWYNRDPDSCKAVPRYWWQGKTARVLPEPSQETVVRDTGNIPGKIRRRVKDKLVELSGNQQVNEQDSLADDLALDSLVLTEFGCWLESEFAVSLEQPDELRTVADCILTAGGVKVEQAAVRIEPASEKWFSVQKERTLGPAEGTDIAKVFLNQARKNPDQVILSDQFSGDKTWRQLILALFVLLPVIRKIPGKRVGIMLPGSVSAAVSWLALVFSGKEPVMVNWTTGTRNIQYGLESLGVEQVITARALTGRLENQGIDLGEVSIKWLFLEELASRISIRAKIAALVRSRISWRGLAEADIADTAAILFTSGSESRPKAVPLSHANLLANVADFATVLSLSANDRQLGILPVFHSLGLAGTVILPLCSGLRTVYWPNPTEGARLGRMIEAYRATMLITTPTFLSGILKSTDSERLASLRLIFSGAEKCPDHLVARLDELCPGAVFCEGYGVTECSPVVTVNSIENPRPGTIGRLLPSMDRLLVDPQTGRIVGPGETGRLLVRGPNVFSGYLGDAPSPFVERDGYSWYDTGDLVREDDGVLVFAGRLKRFVKLGGEMVSLPAIEHVLDKKFRSEDGPVIAVMCTTDEEHPELVLFTAVNIDRQEANQVIMEAGLSALHAVRMVKKIDSIPMLGTGKTDYTALAELVKCL